MTNGPMNWVSLKGHNYGEYWLLKTNHLHVDLEPISQIFTSSVVIKSAANARRIWNQNFLWKT